MYVTTNTVHYSKYPVTHMLALADQELKKGWYKTRKKKKPKHHDN